MAEDVPQAKVHTIAIARTLDAESEDDGRTDDEVRMVLTNPDIWSNFEDL